MHLLRTLQLGALHGATCRLLHTADMGCEHNTKEPKKKKSTYHSHNKGNHGDWVLNDFFSISDFVCWEQVLKTLGKRHSPSSEKHVLDDIDDLMILIRPSAHYQILVLRVH
jgi:hypothetical protein